MMRKPYGKVSGDSEARRQRRRLSIRRKVNGTADCPRLCAIKSNKHLTVQVIDDDQGTTLFSVQTFGKNAVPGAKSNVDGAKKVGATLAEKLKEQNISSAVYDRAGYPYTGIVKTLVDEVRENGIQV